MQRLWRIPLKSDDFLSKNRPFNVKLAEDGDCDASEVALGTPNFNRNAIFPQFDRQCRKNGELPLKYGGSLLKMADYSAIGRQSGAAGDTCDADGPSIYSGEYVYKTKATICT